MQNPKETDSGRAPWRFSLHGAHSGEFCDHAGGTLEETVQAALAAGLHTLGMAEHGPRTQARFLYAEEHSLGWDVPFLQQLFAAYAGRAAELQAKYGGRLRLLRGFEAEVVPRAEYVSLTRQLRDQFRFDYIVGSVHWVDEIIIDYTPAEFARALDHCGSLERLAIRYYETVAEMAEALRPEIIGHLDLVRKYAPDDDAVDTPAIRAAACAALDAIHRADTLLDVNTGGYRKGLGRPYPAPWLVRAATERNVGFTFGDDSHRPAEVGMGIPEARRYLLELGVDRVFNLVPAPGRARPEPVSLLDP